MQKKIRSIGMMLLLAGSSTGAVYAAAGLRGAYAGIIQQSGVRTGIVEDAADETVTGTSVWIKDTANGTITGIGGDFSLNDVNNGDIIRTRP